MDRESDEQSSSDENAPDEESLYSVATLDLDEEETFNRNLPRVRNNDPDVEHLYGYGNFDTVQNMTNEGWEDIGHDISNNTYLETLVIDDGALNDEKLSSLFRGLSKSSSIVNLDLSSNEFSAAGLTSVEPFLKNSINLRELNLFHNNIQTEGFNILWQALRGSPIERLCCVGCGITSIEIETVPNNLRLLSLSYNDLLSEGFSRLLQLLCDSSIEELHCCYCRIESIEVDADSFPVNLKTLHLEYNRINSSGCHGIAKLLREGDNTLEELFLCDNLINDEGVVILIVALKTNTTLKMLGLRGNSGISNNGYNRMLELVNDVSSIKATLHSNHTLQSILLCGMHEKNESNLFRATRINAEHSGCTEAAGREKVIQTQLHSKRRAELAQLQGVEHSLYSEIDPLHLPEVLSLVGSKHGQGELYLALKASIAEVISTINRERYLQQKRAHYAAILEGIDAELAKIAAVKKGLGDGKEPRENKRQRV